MIAPTKDLVGRDGSLPGNKRRGRDFTSFTVAMMEQANRMYPHEPPPSSRVCDSVLTFHGTVAQSTNHLSIFYEAGRNVGCKYPETYIYTWYALTVALRRESSQVLFSGVDSF